jgi:hypothetical protein
MQCISCASREFARSGVYIVDLGSEFSGRGSVGSDPGRGLQPEYRNTLGRMLEGSVGSDPGRGLQHDHCIVVVNPLLVRSGAIPAVDCNI